MDKAPESYLNARRPPVKDALELEKGSIEERVKALDRKGYFTPPPGPWSVGRQDRGFGHYDYAVLDCFGDVVVEAKNEDTAQLIVAAVNAHRTVAQT